MENRTANYAAFYVSEPFSESNKSYFIFRIRRECI